MEGRRCISEEDLKAMKEIDILKLIKDPSTDKVSFNRACDFLLKRYERMFHKNWWTLQRQMGNSNLINSIKDEYYSKAYEAFFTAIQRVDLNKVYDDKFRIMQLLSWYLSNVRSRLIRETLKKSKVKALNASNAYKDEDSMTVDADVEEAYWEGGGYKLEPSYQVEMKEREENCNQILNECFGTWGDLERKIFVLLKNRKTKKEISEALNIKPVKVYNIICRLKRELKTQLGVEV